MSAAVSGQRWVARAPGRVNLVGEHTDYNAGLCLPLAIGAETVATAVPSRDGDSRISSVQADPPWVGRPRDAAPGRVSGWAAYAAGVLWALAEEGVDVPPLEVRLDSTVPLGAGLSSSASLEAAVATVAVAAAGIDLDDDVRRMLVAACRRAETEVVGAPTGGLDQTAVVMARAGHALLLDFADGSERQVPVDLAAAGLALLVVDTRVQHDHASGAYGQRRRECETAAEQFGARSLREVDVDATDRLDDPVLRRRARHVVTENARVERCVEALGAGRWSAVGELLTASHVSLRDDFEVSCAELDLVVDRSLAAGALGARMTGGGFGGSAIVLVPAERADECRASVSEAFAAAGLTAPTHLDGSPAEGAGPA